MLGDLGVRVETLAKRTPRKYRASVSEHEEGSNGRDFHAPMQRRNSDSLTTNVAMATRR
jgi:hypothetical protein